MLEPSVYVRSVSSDILWLNLTHLVVVVRVSYAPEVLKQLGVWATAKNSPFSVEDRMGLVNDAITLAKAGTSSTSGALDLIAVLKTFDRSSRHLKLSVFVVHSVFSF